MREKCTSFHISRLLEGSARCFACISLYSLVGNLRGFNFVHSCCNPIQPRFRYLQVYTSSSGDLFIPANETSELVDSFIVVGQYIHQMGITRIRSSDCTHRSMRIRTSFRGSDHHIGELVHQPLA